MLKEPEEQSIQYIKWEDREPLNIRQLTLTLPYFAVTQGACSDGESIYMIFERKEREGRTHRCKIVRLDAGTMRINKVSDELAIGHGNDMTCRDDMLYITHSAGSMVVHRVDAVTLEQLSDVMVKLPGELKRKRIKAFNGIACYKTGFILRVMGGAGMLITDEDLCGVRYFRTSRRFNESQGMDQRGGITYRAYSKGQSEDKNLLVTFDDSGHMLKKRRLDISGELESVFFVGNTLYGTAHKHGRDKNGEIRYESHVFTVPGMVNMENVDTIIQ